jgi:pimeloyl-ACP methyl ester carboxylesterase
MRVPVPGEVSLLMAAMVVRALRSGTGRRPASRYPAPMPIVRANGLDIGYEVAGAGPPLVLLHGASTSALEDFGELLPWFGTAFRAYAPDARGHASTRWDAGDGFRYEWLVDDALAFADALGLDTFHLLGFSMGAATALGVAVRTPERLRTLVLVGVSPDRQPRASVATRLFDPARILGQDRGWAGELSRRHDPGQGEGAWQRLLPAIAADVASQQLHGPAELRRVDPPVLLAVGDRDPFVPVDQAWRLKRQLPDARLLVAPDCGHEVIRYRPALFREALTAFYRETEDVAAARAEGRRPASRRPGAGPVSLARATPREGAA